MNSHKHGVGRFAAMAWGSREECKECSATDNAFTSMFNTPEMIAFSERIGYNMALKGAKLTGYESAAIKAGHLRYTNEHYKAVLADAITFTDGTPIKVDADGIIRDEQEF